MGSEEMKPKVYEDVDKIRSNPQGGKSFGRALDSHEANLERICDEYKSLNPEALDEDIQKYKEKFVLYDRERSGDINLEELKYMMEKLGQPKTHLELKKMIAQVDKQGKGTIVFMDFLEMMLGAGDSSILKKILKFEELMKPKETPKG